MTRAMLSLGARLWRVIAGRSLVGEVRRNINAAETVRSMVAPRGPRSP